MFERFVFNIINVFQGVTSFVNYIESYFGSLLLGLFCCSVWKKETFYLLDLFLLLTSVY